MGGRGSSSGAGKSAGGASSSRSANSQPQANIPQVFVPAERWQGDKFVNYEFSQRLNQLIGRFNRAQDGTMTRARVISQLDALERSIGAQINANDRLDDTNYLRTALRQTRQTRQKMNDYLRNTKG